MSALSEDRADASGDSVWGRSQHKPVPQPNFLKRGATRETPRARTLVALTATGPIYRAKAQLAAVPMSVGLALIQELAARVRNPEAQVVSSLARRVRGTTAVSAWASTCGYASGTLVGASPRARLRFLSQLLAYVRHQRNANGIEPIVGAAVNAAWPWIETGALSRILAVTSKYLGESEFAAATAIPIADANMRTFTVFAPGALAKIDPSEWLDWKALAQDGFGAPGVPGTSRGGNDVYGPGGLLGPGVPGHQGVDLSGLQGAEETGRGGADRAGNDVYGPGGLLGPGVPGHRGVDLSGLQGVEGTGRGGADRAGNDVYGPGGLLGPGVPGHQGVDLSGLQGAEGTGRGGADLGGTGIYGPGGLLGPGILGHHGLDLSNLGGNGGPFGFGSALGAGGAWNPDDAVTGINRFSAGLTIMSAGLTPVTGGLFLVGFGGALAVIGAIGAIAAAEKPAAEAPPSGDTSHPAPPDPSDEKPDPQPEKPHHNDLYPDPDGTGGNPTQLPDYEGGHGGPTQLPDHEGGGGNPTTLWDEHGGGGNPTTIWDENGGGGNPTTVAEHVAANTLTGPGLLASIVQVGSSTFAF